MNESCNSALSNFKHLPQDSALAATVTFQKPSSAVTGLLHILFVAHSWLPSAHVSSNSCDSASYIPVFHLARKFWARRSFERIRQASPLFFKVKLRHVTAQRQPTTTQRTRARHHILRAVHDLAAKMGQDGRPANDRLTVDTVTMSKN
jgi:hypothetical protein